MRKNSINKLYDIIKTPSKLDSITRHSFYGIRYDNYGGKFDLWDRPDDYSVFDRLKFTQKERITARFAIHGRGMSNSAMVKYIPSHDDVQRPLKLTGVRFSEPVTGLIALRPGVYGVASVHHIAGYKIVIQRFEDTTDDVVWYETPIRSYHCKFDKLEEIIHEHLLEAIQRDLAWNRIK